VVDLGRGTGEYPIASCWTSAGFRGYGAAVPFGIFWTPLSLLRSSSACRWDSCGARRASREQFPYIATFRALGIAFRSARHPTEPTDQLHLCFEREVVVIFAFITLGSDERHAFGLERSAVFVMAE
jgi:hypothetical protein